MLWLPALGLAQPASFRHSVRPTLAERCAICHNDRNASGNISFSSVAAMTKASVVPGEPDGSFLLRVISGDKPRMPKLGGPLSADQVAPIRRWMTEGAQHDSPTTGHKEVW